MRALLVRVRSSAPFVLLSVLLAASAGALPITLYAALHFGALLTPHISGNEALLFRDWLGTRATIAGAWFTLPFASTTPERIDFWSVAPAIALALLPLTRTMIG